MKHTTKTGLLFTAGVLALGAFGSGCQGSVYELEQLRPANLESDEQVRNLSPGSAGSAGTLVLGLLTATRAAQPTTEACPRVLIEGNTVTLEGGCTDQTGAQQTGRVIITAAAPANGRPGEGSATIRSEDLATIRDVSCGGRIYRTSTQGELRVDAVTRGARTEYEFLYVTHGNSINMDTCVLEEVRGGWDMRGNIEYRDRASTGGTTGGMVQIHNGEGRFGAAPYGIANVATRDEVIDRDTCSYEPLSGTTTLSSEGHSAVLTYNGATQCDRAATANWAFDGQTKGMVAGVSCSVGNAPGAAGAGRTVASIGIALCAMLVLQRSIRRR